MSLTPIALLCFALLLRQESLDARRVLAILLGVSGLIVLFWPSAADVSNPEAFAGASFSGGLAVASAAFTYGYGSVLARPLLRTYPALFVAGITTLVGGIALLAAALLSEPSAISALSGNWGAIAWTGWFFLVIFGSLIGLGVLFFSEQVTVFDVIGINHRRRFAYRLTDAPRSVE